MSAGYGPMHPTYSGNLSLGGCGPVVLLNGGHTMCSVDNPKHTRPRMMRGKHHRFGDIVTMRCEFRAFRGGMSISAGYGIIEMVALTQSDQHALS